MRRGRGFALERFHLLPCVCLNISEKGLELIKACEDGDVDEVRKLIAESSGAETNFKDEMDMTPLIYAAQKVDILSRHTN